jgi:hypothetical protein
LEAPPPRTRRPGAPGRRHLGRRLARAPAGQALAPDGDGRRLRGRGNPDLPGRRLEEVRLEAEAGPRQGPGDEGGAGEARGARRGGEEAALRESRCPRRRSGRRRRTKPTRTGASPT